MVSDDEMQTEHESENEMINCYPLTEELMDVEDEAASRTGSGDHALEQKHQLPVLWPGFVLGKQVLSINLNTLDFFFL